jgi:5-methylcytosine-specific restriction protein A
MPNKPYKPCCRCHVNLTRERYCERCKPGAEKEEDRRRGTARERGYTRPWDKYSKWYLKQPDNLFCRKCGALSECVDHIKPCPPNSREFWDPANHQPLCIACNSAKGKKEIRY